MIYSLNETDYPSDKYITEILSYNDRNEFEWQITRTDSGMYIKYLGNEYFKEPTFECNIELLDKYIRIKNNNCIFIKDNSQEMFINIWKTIILFSTDEIWDYLTNMFISRLETNVEILDSEYV